MTDLQTKKTEALARYKEAKKEYMGTISKENIKGDFEKFKVFCDRKKECMQLGVRI